MSYLVLLSSRAQRDLNRLIGTTLFRLEKAILKLESDPLTGGIAEFLKKEDLKL
jgi:hypothetical protein